MAEYIDREVLRNAHIYLNEDGIAVIDVEDVPAADVQPVKHGKWEEVHEWMGDVEYSCSVCGCYALWKRLTTDQVCTEYCPNCGARMDGET